MQAFVAIVLLAASVAAAEVVPLTPAVGKPDITLGKPSVFAYTTQDYVIPAAKTVQYTSPVVASVPVAHPNTYVAGVHPATYVGGPRPVAYVSGIHPSVYSHPYLQPSYVPGVQPVAYAAQHAYVPGVQPYVSGVQAYVPGVQTYVPGHHTNYIAAVQPN